MTLLSRIMRREPPRPAEEAAGAVPEFRSAARTHVGKVRSLNEDRFVEMADAGFWAIADGMGGHRAGDVAAQMIADALVQAADGEVTPARVAAAVEGVNAELLHARELRGNREVSGSTLVALILDDGRYQCLWAGDSRAYLLRDGRCSRISHDHSVVQELVDSGMIVAADAAAHPQAHVITRAVGVSATLSLDSNGGAVAAGDTFLLCSDGLSDALAPAILESCLGAGSIDEMADALLAAALEAGAPDNVTFILIQPA